MLTDCNSTGLTLAVEFWLMPYSLSKRTICNIIGIEIIARQPRHVAGEIDICYISLLSR